MLSSTCCFGFGSGSFNVFLLALGFGFAPVASAASFLPASRRFHIALSLSSNVATVLLLGTWHWMMVESFGCTAGLRILFLSNLATDLLLDTWLWMVVETFGCTAGLWILRLRTCRGRLRSCVRWSAGGYSWRGRGSRLTCPGQILSWPCAPP